MLFLLLYAPLKFLICSQTLYNITCIKALFWNGSGGRVGIFLVGMSSCVNDTMDFYLGCGNGVVNFVISANNLIILFFISSDFDSDMWEIV